MSFESDTRRSSSRYDDGARGGAPRGGGSQHFHFTFFLNSSVRDGDSEYIRLSESVRQSISQLSGNGVFLNIGSF
jgi:hypothetical protein